MAQPWLKTKPAAGVDPAKPPADGPLRARILIVDDDERNAFAACQALEELGHELVTAKSGEEALKRLLVEDFALILLDLHMPGMDGYETAALIRTRRRSADIPIVFLTAVFRDEAHLFQAYTAGAVDVVFKPVDPFILRSKVSILVDLHLKTEEIKRQSEHRKWLLDENLRVRGEKARAEKALRESQERQEAILKCLPIVFTSRSVEPPFMPLFVSDGVRAITGFGPEDFMADREFGLSRIHPDDQDKVIKAFRSCVQTGAYACEFRWRCADGSYRLLLDQGVLAPAQDGKAREMFGTILDVTDRRSLEEQLTQARKMEAVGQLTGGVAHDFNNLLTVVLGNVDLLARRGDKDAKRERQLAAIRHAADRGRSLTRQLLAFSRRQHLNPQTLDANALIRDFAPLMQQAVGEAITIEVKVDEAPHCIHADPAQLETALLNLAVNARDAMPNGGAFSLTTRRIGASDPYVLAHQELRDATWIVIEVSDTGQGMTSAVLDRIFEPFFTTKEVGKGSGLGLSQVYGFVRQSGGHVIAESRPGEGSTFRLFLKASAKAAAERPAAEPPRKALRGDERLLVVEDDQGVLTLTVEMLRGLGYSVVTAADAAKALEVLESGEEIDLLFSDVVMPGGMSGIELARLARDLRPDIRVLLTSGYVGAKATMAESEFPLIDKPYERMALAQRLRDILGARRKKVDKVSRAEGETLNAARAG
ncbi:MAG: response regulator [Proteobacteria bacterium]|nr:response regulator [Pseudomonadota bacterium]